MQPKPSPSLGPKPTLIKYMSKVNRSYVKISLLNESLYVEILVFSFQSKNIFLKKN